MNKDWNSVVFYLMLVIKLKEKGFPGSTIKKMALNDASKYCPKGKHKKAINRLKGGFSLDNVYDLLKQIPFVFLDDEYKEYIQKIRSK